jgi:hypothetical protein
MLRILQTFSAALSLALFVLQACYAQRNAQEPKVVLSPEKPALGFPASGAFGKTCTAFKSATVNRRVVDKPVSVSELFGAQIGTIAIRRYGSGWKKPDDVRKYVSELLKTQTIEVYSYEPWDEFVFENIVADVQFSDHTAGVLEVSGVHICLSDHSRSVLWLRASPIADGPGGRGHANPVHNP